MQAINGVCADLSARSGSRHNLEEEVDHGECMVSLHGQGRLHEGSSICVEHYRSQKGQPREEQCSLDKRILREQRTAKRDTN